MSPFPHSHASGLNGMFSKLPTMWFLKASADGGRCESRRLMPCELDIIENERWTVPAIKGSIIVSGLRVPHR